MCRWLLHTRHAKTCTQNILESYIYIYIHIQVCEYVVASVALSVVWYKFRDPTCMGRHPASATSVWSLPPEIHNIVQKDMTLAALAWALPQTLSNSPWRWSAVTHTLSPRIRSGQGATPLPIIAQYDSNATEVWLLAVSHTVSNIMAVTDLNERLMNW